MRMTKLRPFYFALPLIIAFAGCSGEKQHSFQTSSDDILINQVGYATNSEKKALIRSAADSFVIRDLEGETVFAGKSSDRTYWELSGDSVRVADFSELRADGEFLLCIDDTICSYPFKIGDQLYSELADAALKSYYYARCSFAIDEEYGGKWHRPAGHPDTLVMIHESAADEKRPAESFISSPGGWYDAGDYGKYVVNSSITTWTLLQSLQLNEKYHLDQNLNIPESANELPDILDEALVNLKWMMSMQDKEDGGLYHKLTTKNFDDFIMPHETSKQRYVVQKSTSATLDYASTIAAASRIASKYQLEDLAIEMKESATQAWEWAVSNPDQFYNQPEDFSTGAYPEYQVIH